MRDFYVSRIIFCYHTFLDIYNNFQVKYITKFKNLENKTMHFMLTFRIHLGCIIISVS